ncbi:putative transcription factor [Scheffersomyces amazonensis]|uniref:putative transcription factor n=1 Tax=Scheffersomyces amazonensis TaxID=1078765 RepID=UPI00315DB69F
MSVIPPLASPSPLSANPSQGALLNRAKDSSSPSNTTTNTTTTSNTASSSGKTQTVFIHKLYDMLHDESISHLIWWSPSEDSFYLLPGEEFSKVLAQYFKHTNIASFIRQLNMYGFHKVNDTFQTNSAEDAPASAPGTPPADQPEGTTNSTTTTTNSTKWEFKHSTNQFRKGDIDSLKLIKRRSSKNINSHKEIVNLKSLPPTSNPMLLNPNYPYQYAPGPPPPPGLHHHHVHMTPYSDDESSNLSRHGSSDSLHQQYHQSLQLHQHSLLLNPSNSANPMPNQAPSSALSTPLHPPSAPHTPTPHQLQVPVPHSPHHLLGPLQPQSPSGKPALVSNPSFENSVNFKFIELNNQVNYLKAELTSVNHRYESLHQEVIRNQSDIVQLLDVVESYLTRSDVKPEDDRSAHNKTPLKQEEPVRTLQSDIASFRSLLLQRIRTMSNSSVSHNHGSQSSASAYHLNDTKAANSRNPSNSNIHIVPQHYPLNPHYTIYSNPNDVPTFRKFPAAAATGSTSNPDESVTSTSSTGGAASTSVALSSSSAAGATTAATNQAAPVGRHLSILMDPLQPIPSRSIKPVFDEHHQQPAANFRLRAESKSYSPLTVGGSSANATALQSSPQQSSNRSSYGNLNDTKRSSSLVSNSNSINTPDSKLPPATPNQSYPFPNMVPDHLPPPLLPPSSTRTHSLPTPHVEGTSATPPSSVPPYYNQRNSFTSIYDHLPASSATSAPAAPNQLPSVSELDKSIKTTTNNTNNTNNSINKPSLSASPSSTSLPSMATLLQPDREREDVDDETRKKRKLLN